MDAQKKSITRDHRHKQNVAFNEATRHELEQLQESFRELSEEGAKLKFDLEKAQQKCAGHSREIGQWRQRYCKRDRDAQRWELLVGLRDREIVELKLEIAAKEALIKRYQKMLFGTDSEQSAVADLQESIESKETESKDVEEKPKPREGKKRGKQPGSPGYGRKKHEELEVEDEKVYSLPPCACAECGEPFVTAGSEESYETDVELRAFRRRHKRIKYGHFCKAQGKWITRTAPPAPKIFLKSAYGIGFWVYTLLDKYYSHQPTNRTRKRFELKKLKVSQGTITNGHKKIHQQIKPLIKEIKRYSRLKNHWHIDDTGWKVFVKRKDREGFGWYLWVFRSSDVCVYILDPSRGRKVPKGHLENSVGVVTSDRLSANKKLGEGIEHSYCWVHIRRDLLEIAAADPTIAGACLELLKLIGSIFHFNAARLLNEPGTAEASEAEKNLRVTVDTILKKCNEHLAAPSLHPELQRVVTGIVEDWAGLVLFVDLPAIPPDNNLAEQAIRGAKLGQNGYYGSFSEWSGHFAADMFTLIQTLLFNNEDPEQFLKGYLTACAENGGQAPPNAKDFLPWNRKSPYPKMAESNSSANVEAKRQLALSRKSNGRPQKKKKQNETGSRQSIPGNIPKSNEKQTVNKQTESKASANPTTSTQTRTDTTSEKHTGSNQTKSKSAANPTTSTQTRTDTTSEKHIGSNQAKSKSAANPSTSAQTRTATTNEKQTGSDQTKSGTLPRARRGMGTATREQPRNALSKRPTNQTLPPSTALASQPANQLRGP